MAAVTAPALASRDWRDYAACRDVDPELFFPVTAPNTEAGQRQAAAALAVCRSCRVRADCLNFALGAREGGIWGGTTERERDDARLALTRGTA